MTKSNKGNTPQQELEAVRDDLKDIQSRWYGGLGGDIEKAIKEMTRQEKLIFRKHFKEGHAVRTIAKVQKLDPIEVYDFIDSCMEKVEKETGLTEEGRLGSEESVALLQIFFRIDSVLADGSQSRVLVS